MNTKEQRIYDTCNPKHYAPDWDGEYMAIHDDGKDEATFFWFKMNLDLLDDIFPASWSGNREEILDALYVSSTYADSTEFYRLITIAMAGEESCHTHQSETLCQYGEEEQWGQLIESGDIGDIAEFWQHVLYRYAENDLRELFQEGYDNDK